MTSEEFQIYGGGHRIRGTRFIVVWRKWLIFSSLHLYRVLYVLWVSITGLALFWLYIYEIFYCGSQIVCLGPGQHMEDSYISDEIWWYIQNKHSFWGWLDKGDTRSWSFKVSNQSKQTDKTAFFGDHIFIYS